MYETRHANMLNNYGIYYHRKMLVLDAKAWLRSPSGRVRTFGPKSCGGIWLDEPRGFPPVPLRTGHERGAVARQGGSEVVNYFCGQT